MQLVWSNEYIHSIAYPKVYQLHAENRHFDAHKHRQLGIKPKDEHAPSNLMLTFWMKRIAKMTHGTATRTRMSSTVHRPTRFSFDMKLYTSWPMMLRVRVCQCHLEEKFEPVRWHNFQFHSQFFDRHYVMMHDSQIIIARPWILHKRKIKDTRNRMFERFFFFNISFSFNFLQLN